MHQEPFCSHFHLTASVCAWPAVPFCHDVKSSFMPSLLVFFNLFHACSFLRKYLTCFLSPTIDCNFVLVLFVTAEQGRIHPKRKGRHAGLYRLPFSNGQGQNREKKKKWSETWKLFKKIALWASSFPNTAHGALCFHFIWEMVSIPLSAGCHLNFPSASSACRSLGKNCCHLPAAQPIGAAFLLPAELSNRDANKREISKQTHHRTTKQTLLFYLWERML